MLSVNQVKKRIDNKYILKDISFELEPGEILGILGLNGAGKSSLLKILSLIEKEYSGNIVFNNTPLTHEMIGYVPQKIVLYENLSVLDNLKIFSGVNIPRGNLHKRIEGLLIEFDLTHKKKDKVRNLSGGQKRRLNIAIALIKSPEIILMDEPFVGVDFDGLKSIEQIINHLKKQQKIIIITSHNFEFIKRVCTELLILNNGKMIYSGAKDVNVEEILSYQ